MELKLFGIRHHGPGSARSLRRALEEFRPDVLLMEGPPEAEEAMRRVGQDGLVPPVAMLLYVPDDLSKSVFYPLAEFSPEWQAAKYSAESSIPLRLIDLPAAHSLATESEVEEEEPDEPRGDPLSWVAQAAGDADGESWWERMVEERHDALGLFEAIAHLMETVRTELGERADEREKQREAHMRLAIRQAKKDAFERIAVVTGAWHTPALMRDVPAAEDRRQLQGLPKTKVAVTWVPWTYDRLATLSGYSAGVRSPAYYEHLWNSAPDSATAGWLLKVARLLREEDLDASPASVIEAVRLAEALAAVRDRPRPGLRELTESALSVLCGGGEVPLRLIQRRLIVGERLGEVPIDAPATPLQADLAAEQRRLRLKPEAAVRTLDLDLRNENDLARSHLLRRLRLLDIPWGEETGRRGKGTFRESWQLAWRPELAISVIDAGRWGNTVDSAATNRTIDRARVAEALPELTALAEEILGAGLAGAVEPVMARVQEVAAVAADVGQLLDALPPLATVMRYGDVRRTDTSLVGHVFETVFVRGAIGLPGACASLDEEAAGSMADRLRRTDQVVSLLEDSDRRILWQGALRQIADADGIHGIVAGRVCRLLRDDGLFDQDETSRRLGRASSPGTPPAHTAAWVEGFLAGSGTILLHDPSLLPLLDEWVVGLAGETFSEVLPLLRRTFSTFPAPERRQMGERISGGAAATQTAALFSEERAERVRPLIRTLLGLEEAR